MKLILENEKFIVYFTEEESNPYSIYKKNKNNKNSLIYRCKNEKDITEFLRNKKLISY